jgi:hypothetical protein
MYGSCPALLLEPQRTNLALYSDDATQWTKASSGVSTPTVTANQTTSPDGTTNADKIVFPAISSVGNYTVVTMSFTASAASYSGSVWMRGENGGEVVWLAFTKNGINYTQTLCTLTTSWQRFVLTSTLTSGADNFQIGIDLRDTAESSKPAQTIYVYGRQLELGAYPTTIIPTTTASATRIADSFSRNNIYTNGLITSSGGTWFVELRGNVAYVRDSTAINLFLGDNITAPNNAFVIRTASSASTRLSLQKVVAGSFIILTTPSTDTLKIAFKWNGTSADVFVNGVKEISATAFTTTNMEFLSCIAQNPTFIQQMALFNSALTDAQCQTLTT